MYADAALCGLCVGLNLFANVFTEVPSWENVRDVLSACSSVPWGKQTNKQINRQTNQPSHLIKGGVYMPIAVVLLAWIISNHTNPSFGPMLRLTLPLATVQLSYLHAPLTPCKPSLLASINKPDPSCSTWGVCLPTSTTLPRKKRKDKHAVSSFVIWRQDFFCPKWLFRGCEYSDSGAIKDILQT